MSVSPFQITRVSSLVPASAIETQKSGRLALLDTARVAAAVGIVWVHAATSHAGQLLNPIGTFGVPFYTFVAVLFTARALVRDPSRTLGQYAASRLARIYTPFLLWTAVYVAMGQAKAVVEHLPVEVPGWSMLYAGGFEHLWFLPFLMIVTMSAAVVIRGVEKRAFARALVTIVLIGLGVVACFLPEPAWVAHRTDDQYFWRFGFRALPTVFWSIALALMTVFGGKLPRSSTTIAIGGALLLVSALMVEAVRTPLPVLRSMAGLGCLLVALLPLTSPVLARIGKLGRHSYGIYLSHILFLRIIALLSEHFHMPASLTHDIASFVIAFAGASVLSVLLSQSKYTRWTVGE